MAPQQSIAGVISVASTPFAAATAVLQVVETQIVTAVFHVKHGRASAPAPIHARGAGGGGGRAVGLPRRAFPPRAWLCSPAVAPARPAPRCLPPAAVPRTPPLVINIDTLNRLPHPPFSSVEVCPLLSQSRSSRHRTFVEAPTRWMAVHIAP